MHTTATLAGYGWDFVVADVVSFEPAIFNTPDGKAPPDFPKPPSSPNPNPNAETLIDTPVNVVIDDVVSGAWSAGPRQFLIEGGSVDCYTMRVDAAPRVEPGSRYVFIVSDAPDSEGRKPLSLNKARFAASRCHGNGHRGRWADVHRRSCEKGLGRNSVLGARGNLIAAART